MKHEKRLDVGEGWDIEAHGQYLGYVSGAGEIEVTVNGEVHYLSVNGVYQSFDGFQKVRVKNMSESVGDFVIEAGMGSIVLSQDGQLVEISKIRETVQTEIINKTLNVSGSTIKVSEMPVVEVSGFVDASGSTIKVSEMPMVNVSGSVDASGSTIKVSEMPTVNVSGSVDASGSTIKVSEMPTVNVSGSSVGVSGSVELAIAGNISASESVLGFGESLTIPARTGRKRVLIQAYSDSDDTTFLRVSEESATSARGALLLCGGGLFGDSEQFHTAAIKVWNTSLNNSVTIHILEEF